MVSPKRKGDKASKVARRERAREASAEAAKAAEAPEKSPLDPVLRAAIRGVALTGLVFTVGALVGYDVRAATGVGTGALLATVNLMIFARVGRALIAGQGRTAPWAFVALFKLTALLLGTWLILKHGYVQAIPLAVGFGSLPVGITLGTLFGPKPPAD